MELEGKVVIVTGGASGIGKATCLLFAEEGAKIVVADIDDNGGRDTLEKIRRKGGEAIFIHTDVRKAEDAKKVVAETVERFGKLDVLFNNAGINPQGTVVDTSEELWDQVMQVNLKGIYLCSKFAIPEMAKRSKGSIINTASVNGFAALPNEVAYDASKGGVISLTRAMALDHVSQGIRVNCICPGITNTPLIQRYIREAPNPEQVSKALMAEQPIGRLAEPREIAEVALFLASDRSSFVTGSALFADGGYTAH